MDHHQVPQQGYQHSHPCYTQDTSGHPHHTIDGHNQDNFQHHYNQQGPFETYSNQQHQNQYSPEYQGGFIAK